MTKRRISSTLRWLARERAQGCCEYCLSQESHATQGFSIEHIHPFNAGAKLLLTISRWPARGAIISNTIRRQPMTLSVARWGRSFIPDVTTGTSILSGIRRGGNHPPY